MESIQREKQFWMESREILKKVAWQKGESDIGVNFQPYEEELVKRAEETNCSYVLQFANLRLLSLLEVSTLETTCCI